MTFANRCFASLVAACAVALAFGMISVPNAPAADKKPADKSADSKPAAKPLDPAHAKNMAAGLALFKSDVRQLLLDHCVQCHGGDKLKGEFDLTTRDKFIEGGFSDVGLVPGDHRKSYAWNLIAHKAKPHMPHKEEKLPDEAIAKIGKWIDLGAPYDKPLVGEDDKPKPGEFRITDKDRQFWSFKPLQRVEPKTFADDRWSRTTIDRFITQKHREMKLVPNEITDKRKLIRRAYFDLIGLPPTPAEVDAFLKDEDPNAYANMIDKLLASPHYGERWARHWLDVARFAESHGFEQDYNRPHAYHYRDFVIKAFNAGMRSISS